MKSKTNTLNRPHGPIGAPAPNSMALQGENRDQQVADYTSTFGTDFLRPIVGISTIFRWIVDKRSRRKLIVGNFDGAI